MRDIFDFIKSNKTGSSEGLKIVNIRGCNGAGKSSVPMQMLKSDPDSFTLTFWDGKKNKEFATVLPSYKVVVLGLYRNKTGGLDGYPTNAYTENALKLLWNLKGYNLICEGIMASTLRGFWLNLFAELQGNPNNLEREVIILSIIPPFETCLQRVIERSGNSDVKRDQIYNKWRTVERNHNIFETHEALTAIRFDNSDYTLDDTLDWFEKLTGITNTQ